MPSNWGGGEQIELMTCRFFRWSGTLCAIAVFQWRVYHYPRDYSYIHTSAATFLFVAAELAELAYPFVFTYVRNVEEGLKSKTD